MYNIPTALVQQLALRLIVAIEQLISRDTHMNLVNSS